MVKASPAAFGAKIRATGRSLVLCAIVMDIPVLARAARTFTRTPRVENLELDGVPVEVSIPGGKGPWPAFVFVTGAHPLRRREPVVQRLARSLARGGYVAVVPDLPGLGAGELTSKTLEAARAVTEATLSRPDVREGRVALVGASAGAGIALLTAARPEFAQRISMVAAICPFADLEKLVCLATTRSYLDHDVFVAEDAPTLLRRAVARSLIAALPEARDRNALLDQVGEIEDERDPLEGLQIDADGMQPETQALVRLLMNTEPAQFAELYAALPDDLRELVGVLSPLATAAEVAAPVELAVPPKDPYFPSGEARALAASLPNVHLTITSTLDHTRPSASLVRVRDLVRFERFVVRGLAGALS